MSKPIRHGEVMLIPITKLSGKSKDYTEFIVGHSETGHHHVLISETPFKVTETEKHDLYVQLFEPANLVHKKQVDAHKTLKVAPGKYKVIYKTEYNPWEQIISRVFD